VDTECVVIQIGNSDDKLTQKEWSEYANKVRASIDFCATETHFSGNSPADAPWQNSCWVAVVPVQKREFLFDELKKVAGKFRQDSIAVMVGQTEFLKGE
jgi:hypothetical protein